MKNKKILLFSIINTLAVAYSAGENNETPKGKYEKLYNNIVKNIKSEKSNEENYKLIENILNKRNKELKDLYLQSDYIVKPEYLEWQVFFSGFYNKENRGGKKDTLEYFVPDTSNTLSLSINMPNLNVNDINIDINKEMVEIPNINIQNKNIEVPSISYNNVVNVPEFNIPNIQAPTITPMSVSFGTTSLFSAGTTYDKTFYNPTLMGVQTWNTGLFSNYNLESGNFTYTQGYLSPSYSTSYDFSNAVGSIDPGAIIDPTLNQPAIIPTSATNNLGNGLLPMLVSTSAPNIRIGEDVKIDFSSGGTGTFTYGVLMLQKAINGNRSVVNADPDYAYGGAKQYADSQANIPFSILRNSGTINIYGNNAVVGILDRSNVQTGVRNDYLLVNDGTIIGNYLASTNKEQIGISFSGVAGAGGPGERYLLINDGTMEFRAPNSTAFMMSGTNIGKYQIVQNRGAVTMYGANNVGIKMTYSSLSGSTPSVDQTNTKILMETPINIQGDNSLGVYYATFHRNNSIDSIFKVGIGTEKNSYSGNITGNDVNYVENSIGLYLRPSSISGYSTGVGITTLKNYDLKFGDYAKNGILILNDGTANSYYVPTNTLTLTQAVVVDNSMVPSIDIEGGTNNTVVYNKGTISNSSFGTVPVISVKPDINIGTANKFVDKTLGIYNLGGIVHLTGNINTYGNQSHGIYNSLISATSGGNLVKINGNLDNTIDGVDKAISLIVNGDDSASLYNKESTATFTQGGTFKALGNNGVVFYNDHGTINVSGNAILEADNNGVILYANGGSMNLNGDITYNVKNGSVFATTDQTAGVVQINLTGGNQTLNLEDESVGFLYDGNSVPLGTNSLVDYLNANFSGLNNLNVNISDDSRLFIINNYGTMKLSDLEALNTGGSIFKTVTGNLSSTLLNKGTLELDTVGIVDLDDPNNVYVNTDKASSGIIVDANVTVKGTLSDQIALAGKDQYRGTPGGSTYVVMTNNGTIDLSGDNSIGIYTNNGVINNNTNINVTGNGSAGLFGENGTAITNSGNINISNNGVGIYAVSYQDPQNPETTFGDGTISIVNNGSITTETSSKAIGIYANNNKTGALRSSGTLNLANGLVDVSLSESGTGIYSENNTVIGGGTISVGENGTGIYAKNSDLNLSNLTLNLKGDNSLGIYLDSGSNLNMSGTNTANISGKNNILFYLDSDGIFNQNFVINAASDTTYSLAYLKNNKIAYDGTVVTNGDGALFYGTNSSITINPTASLTSTGNNTVGVYVDGLYDNGNSDYEGINKGIINLKDNSAGLYAINGARLSNENAISVGDMSIGMYNENGSDVKNSGNITIGNSSVGITADNVTSVENIGDIFSLSENATGIYSNSMNSTNILNSGEIELNGKKVIGIYTEGTGIQTFINDTTGIVKIGDSDNITDPSVAVYNNGNVVNNKGSIISGLNSVGIYNLNGTVNQTSGYIDSQIGGIGIYSIGGNINLNGGQLTNQGIGVYALNNTVINNTGTMTTTGDNTTTYVLKSGSSINNNQKGSIGSNSMFIYGEDAGDINNTGSFITMTGKNSIGFYMNNSGNITNSADITGLGTGNVGIYSNKGIITNSGNINLGDSEIIDENDLTKNSYAIGIYGESVEVNNIGNIKIGANGTGIYTENNKLYNSGEITSSGENAVGLWGSKSEIENNNRITLDGDYSQGIVGTNASTITNNSIITLNGNYSIGITGDTGTRIYNNGTISLNGNDSTGIMLSNGAALINKGIINLGSGTNNTEIGNGSDLTPPSITNAGVIKVDGNFVLNGIDLIIQVDPSTVRVPEINEITYEGYAEEDIKAKFLVSDAVHFKADSFDFSNPAMIDPLFTQGTNSLVYKFENVFEAKDIGSVDTLTVDSHSITFRATPSVNENGNLDIWMEKIPYQDFTKGSWYDSLAKVLDENYVNDNILAGQTADALKIYDKLDLITSTSDLQRDLGQLSGSMYANINQREQNITEVLNNTLEILQNSENNTKENVKINIIAGKGSTKEDTSGVESYDYETTGVLALREVERTYRHKFGYSLGYTRTDFQMKDTNNEDQADTIQLGLHNKYSVNGWNIKNDLLGRVSFHDVDRSINWSSGTTSDLNSNYNVYGVSSLNELGKDLEINRNVKVTPYVGLELGYMAHPSFEEKGGAESLKVDSNDAYSVKPNLGIRLDGEKEFGVTSSWKLKGNIGVGYEYELGNMNNQEKVSLMSLGSNYNELAKPAEDKGRIKTSGYAGMELKGVYGIYITGEYGIGQDDQKDYKVGVSLKASF